jgi:hypothetical protein
VGGDRKGPLAAFIVIAIIAAILLITSVRSQAATAWTDRTLPTAPRVVHAVGDGQNAPDATDPPAIAAGRDEVGDQPSGARGRHHGSPHADHWPGNGHGVRGHRGHDHARPAHADHRWHLGWGRHHLG